jgi:hypothetical protein
MPTNTEPPHEPLGKHIDQLHVSADVLLRAYEEYANRVEAGYSEPFETFLLNYTTASKWQVHVDLGDWDVQKFTRKIQAVDVPEDRSIGTITLKGDYREL